MGLFDSSKSKKHIEYGYKYGRELIKHTNDRRGTTCIIFGSKGSGKTTFMAQLARDIRYYNKIWNKETILWRGRETDYFLWFMPDVVIHLHKDDKIAVKDEHGHSISPLPPVVLYDTIPDLWKNIEKYGNQKFNVIYEPRTYMVSHKLKETLARHAFTPSYRMSWEYVPVELWWIEFMDFLISPERSFNYVTIMIDEFDDVCPQSPSGLRWHSNRVMKNIIKDFRKRGVSMYCACHNTTDVDGSLMSKMMYRIYMKGSIPLRGSLVRQDRIATLPIGQYYIEHDAWGMASFHKNADFDPVLVSITTDKVIEPRVMPKRPVGRPKKIREEEETDYLSTDEETEYEVQQPNTNQKLLEKILASTHLSTLSQ